MGLALFKEKRLSQRRKLTGLLPGRLTVSDTKVDIECRPVAVSAPGMGIVIAKEVAPGTELLLLTATKPVRLSVAWGQPDFGKQDMFRYGLVTLDPDDDLEEIFVRGGCLR